MIQNFHFLRPYWLIAFLPALLLFIYALRHASTSNNIWNKYCDAELLNHLLVKNNVISKPSLPYLLMGLWSIAIIALSGPTWSLYAQNVYQKNLARVIVLDVSQSMNVSDIAPTRLERAKYKILDLLHHIKEGQTGMVVFSSAAFVVSPLTNDSNTIASMVPVIDSTIVPVQGSDISSGLTKAADLIHQAGFSRGEIILITGSKPSDQALSLTHNLATDGITTSILAIGTNQGGPLTNADGSLITDNNGNVTVSSLNSTALQRLAQNGKGQYVAFTNDNSDLNQLLEDHATQDLSSPSKRMETKSLWKDEGHWLIWLLIILTAFIARRGWLEKIC